MAGIGPDDVNGEIAVFDCAVADGASVGAEVDMKAKRLSRISVPDSAVACDVTFDVGHASGSLAPLYVEGTEYKIAIQPTRAVVVNLQNFFGIQFVKPKFSVAQTGGNKTFKFIGIPR